MHDRLLFPRAGRQAWFILAAVGVLLTVTLFVWQIASAGPAIEGPPDLSPSVKLAEPDVVAAGGTLVESPPVTPTFQVYLPIVWHAPVFRGLVTFKGAAAAGIRLDLRYFDGQAWSTRATATTASDGSYKFREVAGLSSGQRYRVTFFNDKNSLSPKEAYLYFWGCKTLDQYPPTSNPVCNFDIAAVEMTSPPSMLVSPPVAFYWSLRPATPEDTFSFSMWDPIDAQGPYVESADLGHVDRYLMQSRLPGFEAGRRYSWEPNVRNRYGTGYGYYASDVWLDSFADDFSDPNSGWPRNDTGDYKRGYASGEYQVLVKQADWFVPTWSPSGAALNYTLETDGRRASGALGAYGLTFGIDPAEDTFYLALVDPDRREYRIERYTGSWTTLAGPTPSTAIKSGQSVNRLKLVRDGALIQFFANDQLLTAISDDSLTGLRYVGLVALAFEDNFDTRFDNFRATVIGSGPTVLSSADLHRLAGAQRDRLAGDARQGEPRVWPRKW